jgi:hypothetical protein
MEENVGSKKIKQMNVIKASHQKSQVNKLKFFRTKDYL